MKKKRKKYRQPRANPCQRRENKHHFYHPKKLYSESENIITWISMELHTRYNAHFDHNCKKNPQDRNCHYAFCEFNAMCCYHQSEVEYGRRLF